MISIQNDQGGTMIKKQFFSLLLRKLKVFELHKGMQLMNIIYAIDIFGDPTMCQVLFQVLETQM